MHDDDVRVVHYDVTRMHVKNTMIQFEPAEEGREDGTVFDQDDRTLPQRLVDGETPGIAKLREGTHSADDDDVVRYAPSSVGAGGSNK